MKYLLLIYSNEQSWTPEEREQCMVDSSALCHEMKSKGQYLDASPLQAVSTATSVRIRAEKRLVTDGPFAETTEQLGGYFLIEVKTHDEAVAIASRIPSAKKGTVEIRPLVELSGLPSRD